MLLWIVPLNVGVLSVLSQLWHRHGLVLRKLLHADLPILVGVSHITLKRAQNLLSERPVGPGLGQQIDAVALGEPVFDYNVTSASVKVETGDLNGDGFVDQTEVMEVVNRIGMIQSDLSA